MNEIPDLINQSDLSLCILPPILSYRMSSPTKVVEYLSLGLPVIVNEEIEDQRQVVAESRGGYYIEYNIEKISELLYNIINDDKFPGKMPKYGHDWIINNRNYHKLAKELNGVLLNKLERK